MKVLLLGATGLVGSKVLHLLLDDPSINSVNILARRSTEVQNSKLKEFIGPLNEMEKFEEAFKVDVVLCCLGTTIKKAGSKENFKQVDYEFPLVAAKMAKKMGVKSYGVITALGSNTKSPFFYNKVKGEIENALRGLNFENLFIIRPSLIVGDRNESRFAEEIGIAMVKVLNPLFLGPLRKYAGSKVEDIANLMLALTKDSSFDTAIEYQIFKN